MAIYDTLYYDGYCPLCAKEIAHLKRLQQGKLRFVDIHQLDQNNTAIFHETMLRELHLLTQEQQWLTGLDATVKAWSHTPYGALLRPLRWPFVKPLADLVYRYWANKRYQRYYQCSECKK